MTGHILLRSKPHDIMVVDDSPPILKLLSGILIRKGYTVRTAISGESALQAIAAQRPDLILLDVKMTQMDGFEVCRCLKSKQDCRNIPIIFISALNETDQKIEAFKSGGVDYITKPFQSEEVLVRVETHLKLQKIEKELRESESRLHYLSSCLLAAQENERQRIAMEIHDEFGQNLAVLKLQINSLAGRLRKDQKPLKNGFKRVLGFIDYMIEEMRRISRDLSPSIVQDLKLGRSLTWMLHDFKKHDGIHISHDMIDIDTMFDTKEQVIIYRIFQEALNNIRKHANALHVRAAIKKENDKIAISIEDDGKGFDLEEYRSRHPAERGLGIASLEERARMLGGSLELATGKGKGTSLSLTIPVRFERGGR